MFYNINLKCNGRIEDEILKRIRAMNCVSAGFQNLLRRKLFHLILVLPDENDG
jgi:hypothetical protein